MSFFAADSGSWEEIRADRLTFGPLPEAYARADLRFLENEARVWLDPRYRTGGRPWPGRRELAARWGWTEWRARTLLERDDWHDPSHPVALSALVATTPRSRNKDDHGGSPAQSPPGRRLVAAQSHEDEGGESRYRRPAGAQTAPSRHPYARASDQPKEQPNLHGERAARAKPSPNRLDSACDHSPGGTVDAVASAREREPAAGPVPATAKASEFLALLIPDPQAEDIARRLVEVAGIRTLDELLSFSEGRLRHTKGIGEDRAQRIVSALARRQLVLRRPERRAGGSPVGGGLRPTSTASAASFDRLARTARMLAEGEPSDPFGPSPALLLENHR